MTKKKTQFTSQSEYTFPVEGAGQPVADPKKSEPCAVCGKAVKQSVAHTVTGTESCHAQCLRGAAGVFGRNLIGLRKKYSTAKTSA